MCLELKSCAATEKNMASTRSKRSAAATEASTPNKLFKEAWSEPARAKGAKRGTHVPASDASGFRAGGHRAKCRGYSSSVSISLLPTCARGLGDGGKQRSRHGSGFQR